MEKMHQTCIVCGSRNISDRYRIGGFTLLQCKECSLLFVGEKLTTEQLSKYYEAVEDDYVYGDSNNVNNLDHYFFTLRDIRDQLTSSMVTPRSAPC